MNLFNQVALIAINVIGEEMDAALHNEPYDYIPVRQASKFDDLSFAINQDPAIASLILHLEKNKRTAVQREKYKLAKQIKDCIAELLQVGEELAGYEVQKREAIQREDYNLAEEKRSQSETCRQQAFKRLHLSALLTESDALDEDVPIQQPVVDNNAVVELQPIKMQGDPKVLHSTSDQQYENHDDRPLPTLDKTVSRVSTASTAPTVPGPDALSKKATQEAGLIIKVFGVYTAQLVYSKHFQHRSEGLDNITTELSSSQTSPNTLLLKAVTLVLQKLLKDKVYQVFSQCTELLVELCSSLAEKLRLGKHDLTQLMEKVGHVLLHRLGDNTLRIRQTAAKILRQLAELPLIKKWSMMDSLLVVLPTTRSPWRQVLGQIEILHDICCHGDSNIDMPSTVQFLAHCLEHSQQPIRSAAFDSLLQLYSHHGNSVRQKLPMYEEKKSLVVWRKLFESFDTIDGKPSAADVAAAKKQQEQENQEELCKLQEQHKKLKAIVKSHDHNRSHELSHNVNRCLFCDSEQTAGNMEEHYLNCSMLTYCAHCKQMVEISGLTDHLLGECEVHEQFHKCPRCGEAVHSSEAHNHHFCSLLEDNKQCCPFCHSQIASNEKSWKEHLMGTNSCSKRIPISTLQVKQLRTRTVLT